MQLIAKMNHHIMKEKEARVFERKSARAIILKGTKILLLYTKRYDDYTFPGGGIETDEDRIDGLKRELNEEIGAEKIKVIKEFGYTDEYVPYYKTEYDYMHMLSYFYICEADENFDNIKLEDYELANGTSPVWIDINDAIKHNNEVMATKQSTMGLTIKRETLVLELILEELRAKNSIA
ncbi:NUDIX domain-containing protein [Serpentinicella sp. ANB-PHB4]|uniref:NUDIX domain-containing protein n=1 Tax=Serpentinicella sp. ANB-PHB4 TaxID=3074076 RepID=UPI00285EFD1D|nr:NUDIX domain-containing protein [Serpentinicella sp. ANB-PHB4]MDR5658088.1 NUDIX domain-containing protein [Serpentinicella sp. ANB-PHB4]